MTQIVLYIEDNSDNIYLVERILRRRPETELRVAATGQEGVAAALAQQPDLILLDNRLPDVSGAEVLRQLKSDPVTAAIPVVMLSGDSGKALTRELREAGAAGFIAKPFEIPDFLAEIDRHLS